MKIVVLDGYLVGVGGQDWSPVSRFGEFIYYDMTTAEDDIPGRIGDADVILTNRCPVSAATMDACPNLKLIHSFGTGYNQIDLDAATARGITVCNTPAYGRGAVAQMAVALLFAIARNTAAFDHYVKTVGWSQSIDPNIITTTAAKVILSQNNEQTAERFSKMIGSKTIEVASSSRTEGFSQQTNPFAANISRSLQSSNVVGTSDMMSLDMLKQYVLFQGFLNRPILADAPRWYLDKNMKKKCAMPTAPFVPYWVVAQREETDLQALKSLMQGELAEFDEEIEGA